MRANVATRLIGAIGISTIALCGTAVTARAEPPQDKQHHEQKNRQHPAKPAQPRPQPPRREQPKPAEPRGRQAQAPVPHQPPPQAHARRAAEPQPHSQPAQQARREGPPPQQARTQAPEQHRQQHVQQPQPRERAPQREAQRPSQPTPVRQGHAQNRVAPPAEREQPTRVARQRAAEGQPQAVRRQAPRADDRRTPAQPVRTGGDVARVRLAPQQQHVLINQQQQRITRYNAELNQSRRVIADQSVALRREHRPAQYRYIQSYLAGLNQQEVEIRNYRNYDYESDPYFYTPADYRYYWGGRSYETNWYGISLIRKALNSGYRQGWRAGSADREDGWPPSYRGCFAYRDANYGYNGYYLDRGTYNYYFREGFRRGYEDGYDRSYRYGRYSRGTIALRNSVLSIVLRFDRL